MVANAAPKLEVAFSTAASLGLLLHLDDAVRGKLGTGTLAGSETFVEVTTDLREISTSRGASRVLQPVVRYEAGTLTALLNDEIRDYDPDNLAGPYVAGGVSLVRPEVGVRFSAIYAGITYPLWRGTADNWVTRYFMPRHAEITLTATDLFKVLAGIDRTPQSAAGAGEDTGARMNRILDSASVDDGDRMIVSGNSTVQATTLEGNVLEEMLLTADTELGELYIDELGHVFFRNRLALFTEGRSTTVQATFSAAELLFTTSPPEFDAEQLVNRAIIARVGGTDQTISDTTSINTFRVRVYSRSDLLMETDQAAKDYAGFLVAVGKDAERRFAELVLYPDRDPANLFPQAFSRRIGDRIQISIQPPGGGSAITRDCYIRGISHTWRAGSGVWETRFVLQSATRYAFLVLDHASLGKLDSNSLTY